MIVIAESKKESIILFVVSICCIFFFFLFSSMKSPFIYQTNDDMFLESIVSGQVTGTPEAHMIHIGYSVGLVLSLLYTVFPTLPWYGIFLCTCIGLALSAILWILLKNTPKTINKIILIILFLIGSYSFVFLHIVELQYTFVTSFLACSSLVLFVFYRPSENTLTDLLHNLPFFIITFFSVSIRNKAYLILLPFLLLLYAHKFILAGKIKKEDLSSKEKSLRISFLTKSQKNILINAIILLIIIALSFLIQKIAYSSPEWRDFKKYNTYREEINDYAGYPDYDSNPELYSSFGITKEDYEAIANHYGLLFVPQAGMESFEKIAKVSKTANNFTAWNPKVKLKSMVIGFLDRHLKYTDRPVNLLVYAFYFFAILLSILKKKKEALWEIAIIITARMIIWCYLLYIGRYPTRVTQGVFFAEATLLLAVIWKNRLWEFTKRQKVTMCFWYVSLLLYLLLCFRFGIPKAVAAENESKGMLLYSKSYIDMQDYFRSNPDSFYYLDTNSFTWYTKDALSGGKEDFGNYMFAGSWLPKSPHYQIKLDREGITDPNEALCHNPDVFAVFLKDDFTSYEYLDEILKTKYGYSLKIADEVNVSNNLTYLILKAYEE